MITFAKLRDMLALEAAADSWFSKLSKDEQQAYIKAHPQSKYAHNRIKAEVPTSDKPKQEPLHGIEVRKKATKMPMGRNWYIHHVPTGKRIGDFGFTTRKEAQEFMNHHLQPEHPGWKNKDAGKEPELKKIFGQARIAHRAGSVGLETSAESGKLLTQEFKSAEGAAKRCRFENAHAKGFHYSVEKTGDSTWQLRKTKRSTYVGDARSY